MLHFAIASLHLHISSLSSCSTHHLYLFFYLLWYAGWLNAYKEGGWLPSWASPGYRNCMVRHPPLSYPVLHCPVLFYPVLFYPVLSCPVLSCPVLHCLVLFYPVLYYPVLFYPILYYPVRSCPILSFPVLSSSVLSCPVLHCPVLFYPVLSCLPALSSATSEHCTLCIALPYPTLPYPTHDHFFFGYRVGGHIR